MAATKIPSIPSTVKVNRLYKFKTPDILDENLRSKLPEAYKKFYREWKLTQPGPVHYRPKPGKYELDHNGLVRLVQNVPILPRYPPESHNGLWGGEGVVKGLIKRSGRYQARIPHFFFPILKRGVIYSEILDKYMTTVLTKRTIDLIIDNYGLDHYLLKTKACDIQSLLGLKLKKKMLLALFHKDLYNNNPKKQEEVYNKYKHYVDGYTEEEIEWYGLSEYEALHKLEAEELQASTVPFKIQLRKQLVEELQNKLLEEIANSEPEEKPSKSWISKMNPFGKKEEK